MRRTRKSGFNDPRFYTAKYLVLFLCGLSILLFVAWTIQYLNLRVPHTVLLPPSAPGVLRSLRYDVRYWLIFLGALYGMFLFSALALILFSGKNACCSGIWGVLFVLFFIAYIVFFIVLAREAKNCNAPTEPGNICSHPLKCCDPVISANPASGCPGPTVCNDPVPMFPTLVPPITADKLGWSPDFTWLFWTSFAAMIIALIIFITVYIVTTWEPVSRLDDPLEGAFATTGEFALKPGLPLVSEAIPLAAKVTGKVTEEPASGVRKRTVVS